VEGERRGAMQREMVVYQRDGFRIVTLIAGFLVRGKDGAILDRYKAHELEEAVQTLDEMVERQEYQYVTG